MRQFTAERGVELVLIDIPPQQQYTAEMIHPTAHALDSVANPKYRHLASRCQRQTFYDLKHPNFRGRDTLSAYIVEWLKQREQD